MSARRRRRRGGSGDAGRRRDGPAAGQSGPEVLRRSVFAAVTGDPLTWATSVPKRGTEEREVYDRNLRNRFDARVRKRNLYMLLNWLVSVFFAVLWNQLLFDDQEFTGGFRSSVNQNVFRVIILLLTLLHVAQVVEYYSFQRRFETRSWFLLDSVVWREHWKAFLAAEIFIVALHPLPGLPLWLARHFSIAIIFRSYCVLRVMRDFSSTYRFRQHILTDRALKASGSVEFTWAFMFRLYFYRHPWPIVGSLVIASLLCFSYILYVYEREASQWTLRNAFWNIVITMTTVGYGDLVAFTTFGRITAGVAAMLGIILASILIYVIIQTLSPTPLERHAENVMSTLVSTRRLHHAAARLIQFHWRFHRLAVQDKAAFNARFAEYRWLNSLFKGRLMRQRRRLALVEFNDIVSANAPPDSVVNGNTGGADASASTSIIARRHRPRNESVGARGIPMRDRYAQRAPGLRPAGGGQGHGAYASADEVRALRSDIARLRSEHAKLQAVLRNVADVQRSILSKVGGGGGGSSASSTDASDASEVSEASEAISSGDHSSSGEHSSTAASSGLSSAASSS